MGNDTRAISELFRTASLGAPENAIGFVLWRVVNRYMREVDRSLAAAGGEKVGPGRLGGLLLRGSHRSGLAQFGHPARHVRLALWDATPSGPHRLPEADDASGSDSDGPKTSDRRVGDAIASVSRSRSPPCENGSTPTSCR